MRHSSRPSRAPGLAALAAVIAVVIGILAPAPATASVAPASSAVGADVSAAASTGRTVDTGVVRTADLSQFNPGNIISDAVFFNSSTMSAADIQSFLNSKVSSCQSGYTCLKDYRQTTSSFAASQYCNGYEGAAGETAATIIYKVAVSCGINPQALIVTLQKEQSLITHTAPSDTRYRIAMGQGCPDTAACDSKYFGFQNQVYGAARQFKIYAEGKYFTWYAPGKTWNILYNPNAGCGSAPVYVENKATAGLYYYTPYQPNAASLRAGYGSGDGCSTYGNRNFYQYFNDWFGSTQGETLQVMQVAGTSERYLVSQGQRWSLSTPELAAQFTWIAAVRDVPRSEISALQDRGTAKRAIRTQSGIVWLLDSGQRLRLRDCAQVADYGWDCGSLPLASDAQAARYPDAGWLERVASSQGFTWLIQSGVRRQITDLSLLPRYGIPALSSGISATMLAEYPVSDPVIAPGVYRDASNPYRLYTGAGSYVVPDAASGTAIARSARELTAESYAYLKATSSMPVRMTSGGKSYVMVDDGWLEVTASQYPSSLGFTTLPAGAVSGLPVVGSVSGPHFVRERSDSQVYLVSWGTVQAVSAAEQSWVTAVYGVSSKVWPVLDGAIGDATTPEGMVKTSGGIAYLLDGARAYQFRDCTQVAAWGGDCATLPTVTAAKLGGYAKAGYLQHLVRTPAGTIWLPQGGALRQVLDPGILAVYGIPATTSPVSTATIAKLPVGEPALAAGVYSDGANARAVVTQGGEYTLTADQSVGVVRSTARALTAASFAKITIDGALPSRMRSDGRSFILTTQGWLEVAAGAYGGDAVFTQVGSKGWTGIAVAANEPRPHFVRDNATGAEYLISSGTVQPVSGDAERAAITRTYGVPSTVWSVVGGALSGLRISYDLIAKSASGEIYLMDGSTRYRMSGCGAVTDFGRDCATLRTLTAAQLAGTTDGGALAALLRSSDGFVWLPQSGTRREVPNPAVLAVYGVGTASTPVTSAVLSQLRLGPPVAGVGMYDDGNGDVRVVTGDGRAFSVPVASRIGTVTSGAWRISPASLDLLTVEGDLPTRIQAGSASLILTRDGWLTVDPTAYAPLSFTSIGNRGAEGIRSAGTQTRPHFVREQSTAQVYLASGGLTPVADQATLNWIAATYGVPTTVWIVPDGALR